MQRHILRNLPRVQAKAFVRATAATAAKASPVALTRQFSSKVPVKQTNLLINGEFVPSSSGRTFETFNPATEEKIADVSEAVNADIDAAVAAARDAFEGPWRTMSAENRGRLLYKLADLIEENIDEIAALEALDNGKPFHVAKENDLQLVLKTLRYYAGWPDKIHGSVIPISGPYLCYTKAEPVGVCAQIIPWNFPLLMMAWKLGPALAAGNTIVLKPANRRLSRLSAAGRHLAQHPDVDKVAFTGSTEVGYQIMRTSHVSNLKRVTLELGGKSANIILDDADIDLAIKQSQLGLFMNQGQCCISGTRVFVQEGIYDEFVKRSAEAANARIVGDSFDDKTDQGSQIDEAQFKKILGYVEKGKEDGARLVAGGHRKGDKGWFIEPTVFADVTDDMTIAREEIFGPVMSILKFKTIDEVIARANDSEYGLGGGVVTSNIDNAIKIWDSCR
ncbi:Aldehyde dehydrogenase [Phytophthora fragariae]|uniref:Aldehyde dehydrogenase n=1 Tax=Phytophthora fragariae TaxID=53985 RepID=A0A6A3H415_9STRA|nr:Aldehyde dehydrogenase [Phytophthora fragariae]KAE8963804.1 Aldehyde dehydrogenase [Phytophthora fragariae]